VVRGGHINYSLPNQRSESKCGFVSSSFGIYLQINH
jgi:hypothetical protein